MLMCLALFVMAIAGAEEDGNDKGDGNGDNEEA